MDLSIIIPCHNLENYIEKCIDSILAQDIPGYECEIIFVCDKCTDNTIDLIGQKMAPFHLFEWTLWRSEDGSPGLSRNVGLQTFNGDHIWFIDGDDWLTNPNAIQNIMLEFKNSDIDIVKFEYEDGLPNSEVAVWRYVFKSSILEDILFNSKAIAEDVDFMNLVWKKKPKMKNLKEVYYHYNHPRKGSIMTTALSKNWHGSPSWKR